MIGFILAALGGLFSFLITGMFFAAVMVGGLFWAYSRDLPSHEQLAQYTPPTISRIYSGEGRMIDEFAVERRIFAPVEEIPDLVKAAFISAEDKNFYIHRGYDVRGIAVAGYEAVRSRGQNVRGASTITQQVTKNFLLSSDRTGERKIKEIILASRIEETLSKDRILELYLNEIFLGQNSFGVAAAAQTYFNKTLGQLSVAEAAFLAALPQAPSNYHPVRARERVTQRRNWILGQMLENGYIDEAAFEAARDEPLLTVQAGDFPAFRESLPPRDYFTDEIRRQLSGTFGEQEFFGGGLTIRATVEPDLQEEAARALRAGLERYDRGLGVWRGSRKTVARSELAGEERWRTALAAVDIARDIDGWYVAVVLEADRGSARIGIEGVAEAEGGHRVPAEDVTWARKRQADGRLGRRAQGPSDLVELGDVVHVRPELGRDGAISHWSLRQVPEVQGAFMAMDVNTGRVLAMQGGFSYQDSVFNRATQAQRQPGSAFKPFVYAAALDSGYTPATIVIDAPIEVDTPQGLWRPTNASDRYYGPTPIRTGIEQSRNLMTVRLAQEIGMDLVAQYAERFGVYDPMAPFLANALGAQETTLFKMVAAYAMFANGGVRVEPTLVDRVQDRWGRTVYRHDSRRCEDCQTASLGAGLPPRIRADRERVMDPITAYQLTSMMEGVVQRGTGRSIRLPVPVAGKTGTTNESKDVWFIGYTSNIVAGCYIGYDRPRSLGSSASGGGMCGPVFSGFMEKAVARYGGTRFTVPPGGRFVKIDRFSGARLADNATGDHVVAEYFREGGEEIAGLSASVVDGGFAIGSNLPLFQRGESDGPEGGDRVVTTSTGQRRVIPPKASFGTLSSGGLY
ncbi:MAG: PBP1A family penicillin-binding protein [Rhodobacteraceae bacterium]|nr:PBP1A family penicillin-binding protein [Paracoccaceae bacterium]